MRCGVVLDALLFLDVDGAPRPGTHLPPFHVIFFSSLFATERRGGLVCFGAVVVIAIGLECALWCCAGWFVVFGC